MRCRLLDMQDDLAVFQPAAEYVPLLDEVYERLQGEVASVPGAFVEHNKFSVSVHFRRVAEQVSGVASFASC
jgi:trehalose 6-phosphate phosphatase